MVKYKFNRSVRIRKEEDDVFLVYVPKYRNILLTNTIGYEILYLLSKNKSVEEIFSWLINKYEVDSKVLENDLITFLKKCEEAYIIFSVSG
jgi:hypothetical protein